VYEMVFGKTLLQVIVQTHTHSHFCRPAEDFLDYDAVKRASLAEFHRICPPSFKWLPESPADFGEDPTNVFPVNPFGQDDEAGLSISNENPENETAEAEVSNDNAMKELEAATAIVYPPPVAHKVAFIREKEVEGKGDDDMKATAESDLPASLVSSLLATNTEVGMCEIEASASTNTEVGMCEIETSTSTNLVSPPPYAEEVVIQCLLYLAGLIAAAQALQQQSKQDVDITKCIASSNTNITLPLHKQTLHPFSLQRQLPLRPQLLCPNGRSSCPDPLQEFNPWQYLALVP